MARVAVVLALGVLALLSAWFIHVGLAIGHEQGPGSWINRKHLSDPGGRGHCCNNNDCTPVVDGGIQERAGGYHVVETGEHIPYSRVLWESQDGQWWRCRFLQDVSDGGIMGWNPPGSRVKYKRNDTRCLIGPPPGM